ncbi:NTP transferase domain-containing protein [Candidatus Peregrinibacteria bacterium]|nr:NTP transferase domain-containing protein [Candidatus Peregrinibacteria bacterium]MBI3816319.1 NTP transferase domain-containing protein [Candidatus Peregrinibacteria bacterium]
MKTLLLLAGHSRRFWPLEEKSLFPLCGKTLLEHQVKRLHEAGCEDITLVCGEHNRPTVHSLFPKMPVVVQADTHGGMRAALLSALPEFGDAAVMIVGGNDVVDPSAYRDVQMAAREKGVDGAILARKVDRYFPGGYLTVKGRRVTGIVEKPGAGNEPGDLVNIVAHAHNDASLPLAALKNVEVKRDDGYEAALSMLFEEKIYHAAPYSGPWQPVKYAWHLLPLLSLLLEDVTTRAIHPSVQIHPSAVVEGPVVIGEGSTILPHATVIGPCVIGRGTTIGNNALVRTSSIADHCVIGYNTEVKASVLADHVWTHSTYVGDSVIGENVSFGGGCMTGNLRLDEEEIHSAPVEEGRDHIPTGLTKFGAAIGNDTSLGIHVGLNPGIKIGTGTFVAGGTCVTEDIPEGSFVRMKGGKLSVSPNTGRPPRPEAREKYR